MPSNVNKVVIRSATEGQAKSVHASWSERQDPAPALADVQIRAKVIASFPPTGDLAAPRGRCRPSAWRIRRQLRGRVARGRGGGPIFSRGLLLARSCAPRLLHLHRGKNSLVSLYIIACIAPQESRTHCFEHALPEVDELALAHASLGVHVAGADALAVRAALQRSASQACQRLIPSLNAETF